MWPECGDARYVVAAVLLEWGRIREARAQAETLMVLYPGDRSAKALAAAVRARAEEAAEARNSATTPSSGAPRPAAAGGGPSK